MVEFDKQFTIESPTGAELNCYYTAAKGSAHGIVHINHGLAEHAVRYGKFARDLSIEGYHVYAHDHRGHGFTKTPDAPQGSFSLEGHGVKKVLTDCAAVQDHATRQNPNLPIHMFGHSMGGLITMNFALQNMRALAGFSVWNSNFDAGLLSYLARILLKYERFRLGSDVPSRILPKLTFDAWAKQIKNRRTDFDWLSHIDKEVDAYIADPLCGWNASVGMWLDIVEMSASGTRFSHEVQNGSLPFADLVGGDEDPATNSGKAVEKLTSGIKNLEEKAFSSRTFANTRHETLNDYAYEDALAHFLSILDRTCKR